MINESWGGFTVSQQAPKDYGKVLSPLETQVGGDHYKKYAIQPVEFCYANNIPYLEATAIKYLCRWRDKNGIQDLEKAKHFIELLIDLERKKDEWNNPNFKPF